MKGLEIVSLILANAPAAVATIGQLKALVEEGFAQVKDSVSDDQTIEDARAAVLALMDAIAAKSEQIQAIE